MNVQRLYWLTFGWFGLIALVNGAIGIERGNSMGALTAGAGFVLLVIAGWSAFNPESSEAPDEPGWLLYVGLVAAGIYTIGTVFRLL